MKKKITDKALILKKWGQEVSTGKPNPGLMGHQIILEGILEDFNWSDEEIFELFKGERFRLLEAPENKKIKWKDEKGNNRETDLDTIRGYKYDDDFDKNKDKQLAVKAAGLDDKDSKGAEEEPGQLKGPGDFERNLGGDGPKDGETGGQEQQPKSDKDKTPEELRKELYGENKKNDHLLPDETPHSDRQSKNDVITHGYGGMLKATGKNPAPGDAGSALNEIGSGEGAKILKQKPDITDEQLTMVLYNQLCGTALGEENKAKPAVITTKATKTIPKGVETRCYTKMKIIAKAARRKHDRAVRAAQNLGENGTGQLIGKTKTHEYYGSEESLDKQCEAIDNAETVLAPDGTEIPKESTWKPPAPTRDSGESYRDYHKRVQKWAKETGAKRTETGALDMAIEGGGGENPSDTATFLTDEKGNLVMMFASDKATTADQQANSTVTKEIKQKIEVVKDTPIDRFPGKDKKEKQKYKEQLIKTLEQNIQEIDEIEADLKGNLATTSDLISEEDPGTVVDMLGNDKLADGTADPRIGRGGRGTSKYWNGKRGVVKSYGPGKTGYITSGGKMNKGKTDQLYWLHQTKVDGDKKGYYPDSKGGEKEPDKAKMNYYNENPPGEKDILKAILTKTKEDPESLTIPEATLVERYSRRMVEHYTNLAKNESDPEKKKMYLEKAKGFNISEKTEETRRRTIRAERNHLNELNKDMMTLPNGTQMPMGDYLEATNLNDKLHLGQMDKDAKGVYKYPGLMEVNMGGVVVDAEVLKKCLDVETSGEVIENFEVGAPEDEDEIIRSSDEFETDDEGNTLYFCKDGDGEYGSDENGFPVKGLDPLNITNDESKALRRKSGAKAPIAVGRVTGRNLFIYAITKDKKRIPIAKKSLRTKTGKIGRFATTYVWADEMQDCFKDNDPPINEPVTKEKN